MSDAHFECTQCGWCCVDLLNTFDASLEDILRWKKEARFDIITLRWDRWDLVY